MLVNDGYIATPTLSTFLSACPAGIHRSNHQQQSPMDKIDIKGDSLHHAEVAEDVGEGPPPSKVRQLNAAMYEEALDKYGKDGSIDPAKEKQLKR